MHLRIQIMTNEKTEQTKMKNVTADVIVTSRFKVGFEFLDDYDCLNQFATALSDAVTSVTQPSYNFSDGRYGQMMISVCENKQYFIAKLLNLISNQTGLHQPRCKVTVEQLSNDMKTVLQTDAYDTTFSSADTRCLATDATSSNGNVVLWLSVNGHVGDMHKVEFVTRRVQNQDGAILDGQ